MNKAQKIVLIVGSIAMLTTLFFVRWTWGGEPYSSTKTIQDPLRREDGRLRAGAKHVVPTTEYSKSYSTIAPVFSKPDSPNQFTVRGEPKIDTAPLIAEWVIILFLTGVFLLLFKDKPQRKNEDY